MRPRLGVGRRVPTVRHLLGVVAVVGLSVLTSGCTLWGWGVNTHGQVGIGTTTQQISPAQVGATTWKVLSAGGTHTCGIRTDTTLWCWGNNDFGGVGNGGTVTQVAPVVVSGTSTTWKAVAASDGGHTCAIRTDDTLWCWGRNDVGQIGDGTNTMRTSPVRVGTATWKSVVTGYDHTCGIRSDDTLWCWGRNTDGEVGDGTTTNRTTPVRVGTATWKTVAGGSYHTCGTRTNDTLWCWGGNTSGRCRRRHHHRPDQPRPGRHRHLEDRHRRRVPELRDPQRRHPLVLGWQQ